MRRPSQPAQKAGHRHRKALRRHQGAQRTVCRRDPAGGHRRGRRGDHRNHVCHCPVRHPGGNHHQRRGPPGVGAHADLYRGTEKGRYREPVRGWIGAHPRDREAAR